MTNTSKTLKLSPKMIEALTILVAGRIDKHPSGAVYQGSSSWPMANVSLSDSTLKALERRELATPSKPDPYTLRVIWTITKAGQKVAEDLQAVPGDEEAFQAQQTEWQMEADLVNSELAKVPEQFSLTSHPETTFRIDRESAHVDSVGDVQDGEILVDIQKLTIKGWVLFGASTISHILSQIVHFSSESSDDAMKAAIISRFPKTFRLKSWKAAKADEDRTFIINADDCYWDRFGLVLAVERTDEALNPHWDIYTADELAQDIIKANKTTNILLRVSEDQKALMVAAAEAAGFSLSAWLRHLAIEEATRSARSQERIKALKAS